MAYKGYNPGVVSSAYSAFIKKAEKDEKKREKKNLMIAQMTNSVIKSVFTGIKARDTKIRADLKEGDVLSTNFKYKDKTYDIMEYSKGGSWGGILGGNLKSIDKRVEYSEEFLQLIENDPDAYQEYLKQIKSGGDLYDWNKELLNTGVIHSNILPNPTAYDDLVTKHGQDLVDKMIGDKNNFYEIYGSGKYDKVIKKMDKTTTRAANKKSKNIVDVDPVVDQGVNLAEKVENSEQFLNLTSLDNLNIPDDDTIKEFILKTGDEFDKKYDVFDDNLDAQYAEANVSPGAVNKIGGITPGALSAADASMENYFATVGSNVADAEVFDPSTEVIEDTSQDANLFTAMDLFIGSGQAWQNWSSDTDWFDTDVTIDSDSSVT